MLAAAKSNSFCLLKGLLLSSAVACFLSALAPPRACWLAPTLPAFFTWPAWPAWPAWPVGVLGDGRLGVGGVLGDLAATGAVALALAFAFAAFAPGEAFPPVLFLLLFAL